jgi:cytochrome c553
MKNIVVAFFTILIVGLTAWVAVNGGAYNGGIHGKVTEDIGNRTAEQMGTQSTHENKDDREKEMDQLNALREKAGNVGAFKVSDEYKSKCSSCHGVNGSGEQNGKKLMGPKLFGQTADEVYTKLDDFKAGRKENMIMKGLLIKLDKDDLRRFANEIGEFPARAEAVKN